MILGIDASNITTGGGLTHCKEILKSELFVKHGFKKIIIWSSTNTLDQIKENTKVIKKTHYLLNFKFIIRIFWNLFFLKKSLKKENCDILLVLGGYSLIRFRPTIIIFQNMLPFEKKELTNFGFSLRRVKLEALRFFFFNSLKKSEGIIFLSKYAFTKIKKILKTKDKQVQIIPHGISNNFFLKRERKCRDFNEINSNEPFKIIYVSNIDMYKHQWNVVEAVSRLIYQGYHITIDFIGGSYAPALKKFEKKIESLEDSNKYISYRGNVPHSKLHFEYLDKDLILFASSCENLPIILLEGMATKLPIVSSNLGPMKEVLGEHAIYFNPYDADSIYNAIKKSIHSCNERNNHAKSLLNLSKMYSWEKVSEDTFKFIAKVNRYK